MMGPHPRCDRDAGRHLRSARIAPSNCYGINTGQFEPNLSSDGFLGQNALGSWYLTLATCLFLGPAAHVVASAFTGETLSIADFITISIIGGILGSVVVGGASLGIALLSHRRRWDLDSVSAPLVTAIGDIATLPALWLAAIFVQRFEGSTPLVAAVTGALCLIGTIDGLRSHLPVVRRIVRESIVVLFVAGVIDLFAGTLVEVRLERFLALPALLILVPPFLEDSNALAGILSSRLGSKLHLGLIEPRPIPQRLAWIDIAINFVFATSVFFLVGFSANLVAVVTGLKTPGFLVMIEYEHARRLHGHRDLIDGRLLQRHRDVPFRLGSRQPQHPHHLGRDASRWHALPRPGYPSSRRDRTWITNPGTSKSSSSS